MTDRHGDNEDAHDEKEEAGRHDTGTQGSTDRPTGESTARDATSIDPQDPIDDDSPNLRPA